MFARIDPIKWLDDLLCSAVNGRGVQVVWVGGQTGAEGEVLLRSFGVRCWGRVYDYDREGRFGVTVRRSQAAWAASLLAGHGFCVVSHPNVRPIRPASSWGKPAPAQGFAGLAVGLFQSMPRHARRADRRLARRKRRRGK